MNNKTKKLITNLALPLISGGISAFITRDGMKQFESMNKPALTPPQWAFPVVWSILYVMMGIAAYQAAASDADEVSVDKAMRAYYIQLALNFVWSIIFFGMKQYLAAFCELAILWISVVITFIRFKDIKRTAGMLLVPYLIWLTLAMYLNWGVYMLN